MREGEVKRKRDQMKLNFNTIRNFIYKQRGFILLTIALLLSLSLLILNLLINYWIIIVNNDSSINERSMIQSKVLKVIQLDYNYWILEFQLSFFLYQT